MSGSDELVQNIKSAVVFKKVTNKGAHTLKCPVCNDSKVRAAFFFAADHIGYNCFRGSCDGTTKYEFEKGLPKKFKELMRLLNVEIPVELRTRKKRKVQEDLNSELYHKHFYTAVSLPSCATPVDANDVSRYASYLREREIYDIESYSCNQGEYANSLIIPFHMYGNLIGFQAINIYNGRYITYTGTNSHLLYSPSGRIPDSPIIVEGLFDALSTPNGIAVLGPSVTKEQAYHLRQSKPILLPDRKGSQFLRTMQDYGWRMSVPRWDCKDANEAIIKYGRLTVARMIREAIIDKPTKAEVEYKLWRTK